MKVGALILGIIGGLIALSIGYFGFSLGSLAGDGLLKFISLAIPIASLIGAGIVMSKPALGATLMGFSAFGLVFVLGFNFISMIPVVLLAIGSILGFSASSEQPKNTSTPTT